MNEHPAPGLEATVEESQQDEAEARVIRAPDPREDGGDSPCWAHMLDEDGRLP
jgi:hypothetical protein